MAIKRSPRPEGRITSISPALTTKNGTSVWPPSINTSPRVMGRINPWEAIREICVVLSTGNKSGAFALVRGVEGVAAVDIIRHLGLRVRVEPRRAQCRPPQLHGKS